MQPFFQPNFGSRYLWRKYRLSVPMFSRLFQKLRLQFFVGPRVSQPSSSKIPKMFSSRFAKQNLTFEFQTLNLFSEKSPKIFIITYYNLDESSPIISWKLQDGPARCSQSFPGADAKCRHFEDPVHPPLGRKLVVCSGKGSL